MQIYISVMPWYKLDNHLVQFKKDHLVESKYCTVQVINKTCTIAEHYWMLVGVSVFLLRLVGDWGYNILL